jgi:hypothetical protein
MLFAAVHESGRDRIGIRGARRTAGRCDTFRFRSVLPQQPQPDNRTSNPSCHSRNFHLAAFATAGGLVRYNFAAVHESEMASKRPPAPPPEGVPARHPERIIAFFDKHMK